MEVITWFKYEMRSICICARFIHIFPSKIYDRKKSVNSEFSTANSRIKFINNKSSSMLKTIIKLTIIIIIEKVYTEKNHAQDVTRYMMVGVVLIVIKWNFGMEKNNYCFFYIVFWYITSSIKLCSINSHIFTLSGRINVPILYFDQIWSSFKVNPIASNVKTPNLTTVIPFLSRRVRVIASL